MTTETVTGRSIPRATGPEPIHDVRLSAHYGGFERPHVIVAHCAPCEWETTLADGHTVAELVRLERQHAGTEDP